jgi:peptidoglycan/xylan/chitin deacetylase (PgdA/CDA1 family)
MAGQWWGAGLFLAVAACAGPIPSQRSTTEASAVPAAFGSAASATAPLQVAITVDDLPVHGPPYAGIDRDAIAERLLSAFAAHRVPSVYGFVNGQRVDEEPTTEAILRRWLAAGHPLGNHTWSHPSLNATPLPDYQQDIERGEAILVKLGAFGEWRPFRYPFLFEGDTHEKRDTVRQFLAERGYTRAPVTIEAEDWAYNPPFARCAERGDTAAMQALVADLVARHVGELERVRDLTRALVGRDITHVLLLHIGAADAAAIEPLLAAFEQKGVRWIDLPTALADPFYELDTKEPLAFGSSAPYRLAKERGIRSKSPPDDPQERLRAFCSP